MKKVDLSKKIRVEDLTFKDYIGIEFKNKIKVKIIRCGDVDFPDFSTVGFETVTEDTQEGGLVRRVQPTICELIAYIDKNDAGTKGDVKNVFLFDDNNELVNWLKK